MRILVVGTHPLARQPSMNLFATWVAEALSPIANVRVISAPAVFLNRRTRASIVSKWLGYLDQYVLLTFHLAFLSRGYDLVLIADHGNAPASLLVPASRLAVMVHDTIAMRQALRRSPETPPTGRTGRLLQAAIRRAVSRARLVLSNPGCVPAEVRALGLAEHPVVVGCPVDQRRLDHPKGDAAPKRRYVLNVASDGWRKRKADLVPLWREVQKYDSLALVLAGYTTPETLQRFSEASVRDVVVMNDVDDATLADLYRGCEALITASHEEGLCIPVLEALTLNKVVFAPDLTPSYVDFFGEAVKRLSSSSEAAARQIVETLRSAPPPKADDLLAWCSQDAFNQRVRASVEGSFPATAQTALAGS